MSFNERPSSKSPSSILKQLKQLDDRERIYHAKILEISAERAQLFRLLESSLTHNVLLDPEAVAPVTLSTQQLANSSVTPREASIAHQYI